jgi:hypothetical protein
MKNFLMIVTIVLIGLAGCTSQPAAEQSLSRLERLAPVPELLPEEVVAIQMRALQLNDDADRGIAVVFRFASPQNRQSTGPLSRFSSMIKNGPYAPMLNYVSATFEDPLVRGDEAMQRVSVTGADGLVVDYVFLLSRQPSDPYANCWMTDGVVIEAVRRTGPSARA